MVAGALAGRTVLVTGGSSGIGKAIAIAAARAGADVAITYRGNAAGAEEVQRAIGALGRRTSAIHLDLASAASLADLAAAARRALGRVDVWINNAGADILTGDAASLSRLEKLDRLIAVDLRGTMMSDLFMCTGPSPVLASTQNQSAWVALVIHIFEPLII